jgi:hypothetical protein
MSWTAEQFDTELRTGAWAISTSDQEQTIGEVTGVVYRAEGGPAVLHVLTAYGMVLVHWAQVTRLIRMPPSPQPSRPHPSRREDRP